MINHFSQIIYIIHYHTPIRNNLQRFCIRIGQIYPKSFLNSHSLTTKFIIWWEARWMCWFCYLSFWIWFLFYFYVMCFGFVFCIVVYNFAIHIHMCIVSFQAISIMCQSKIKCNVIALDIDRLKINISAKINYNAYIMYCQE